MLKNYNASNIVTKRKLLVYFGFFSFKNNFQNNKWAKIPGSNKSGSLTQFDCVNFLLPLVYYFICQSNLFSIVFYKSLIVSNDKEIRYTPAFHHHSHLANIWMLVVLIL